MLIKDILTIDLSEDLKHVIDLEDTTDSAIQSEIENYIITNGLAREYDQFISRFTSNIKETGVWISGFYGSGKSYFGKLLGYMLSNRLINGTPARDRILNRFTGLADEELIKNNIARLDTEKCRVIFLDIAKQDTTHGLSYALFRNFLKSLLLPENEHGYLLFTMMVSDGYSNIRDYIYQHLSQDWNEIRSSLVVYAKAAKQIYTAKGNTDQDYQNILTTLRRETDQFSAAKFRDELAFYLNVANHEKLVFIFDEASEALNQKKYTLTDLEGLSEALSDSRLEKLTWTIAIAQEKLDDVISNSNISKANLTKVTDRFKTKIHLEATEVDVIIRQRLLTKTDAAVENLTAWYHANSGKIADHAGIQATGVTKTNSLQSYVTYYPFYKYQFDLLQNFLFGARGTTTTTGAARGMISTIYDVLKLELCNTQVFATATSWQIAREAQTAPPTRLSSRYASAESVLKEEGSPISGRKLLETINFLYEAEVVPTTLPNIVKAYIGEPEDFYKVKDDIEKALGILIEARLVLYGNNKYRITSDLEQRMLEEMRGFSVQGFMKKKLLVSAYKNAPVVKNLVRVADSNLQYDFYMTTDSDDELNNPSQKFLKLRIKSVYNQSDDRTADIELLRMQHQNDKDLIWMVPDNSGFKELDKLIDDIQRITFLEDKYQNPQSDEGLILRAFSNNKAEKEERLKTLVEESLHKATAIYLFNLIQLNKDNWQTEMQGLQRQVVRNVYFKRLDSHLSDTVAPSVIKEHDASRLHSWFHGADFRFFDTSGNFTGEHLKPSGEILAKIKNTFVDGKTLEKELEQPPTGFTYGSVISSVAALVRGGKVIVKHNGNDYYSWNHPDLREVFAVATKFRSAGFKAITRSLTPQQKNDMVNILRELKCDEHLSTSARKVKIDWNTNDFELVQATREMAKHFCDKVDSMRRQNKDFDTLFASVAARKDFLAGFTGAISDANYVEKAENFLNQQEGYTTAVQMIEKVEKFIGTNLPKVKLWKTFADAVNDELNKAAGSNNALQQAIHVFNDLYKGDVVKNYTQLQTQSQQIKDAYYALMIQAADEMAAAYIPVKAAAEELVAEIDTLKIQLNQAAGTKAGNILQYASQRTSSKVDIGFDVKDKNTRFTWSEMLSFIELAPAKLTEIASLKASLTRVVPGPGGGEEKPTPQPKVLKTQRPAGPFTVGAYRKWLAAEQAKLTGYTDTDQVELT